MQGFVVKYEREADVYQDSESEERALGFAFLLLLVPHHRLLLLLPHHHLLLLPHYRLLIIPYRLLLFSFFSFFSPVGFALLVWGAISKNDG